MSPLQHGFDVGDGSTVVNVRVTVPTLDVACRHPVSLVGQSAHLATKRLVLWTIVPTYEVTFRTCLGGVRRLDSVNRDTPFFGAPHQLVGNPAQLAG